MPYNQIGLACKLVGYYSVDLRNYLFFSYIRDLRGQKCETIITKQPFRFTYEWAQHNDVLTITGSIQGSSRRVI